MCSEPDVNKGKYYAAPLAPVAEKPVLRYYMDILLRRIWVVVSVLVIVLTIGIVNAFRAVNIYQAVAKVLIDRQTPRVMNMEALTDNFRTWDPEFYETQVELIRSQTVLERAVKMPKLEKRFAGTAVAADEHPSSFQEFRRTLLALLGAKPSPPPEPWEKIRGLIRADHLKETRFVLIKAEHTDPRLAADLADAVALAFEQHYLAQRKEAHSDAFIFLQTEKEKEDAMLTRSEKALQTFRELRSNASLDDSHENHPTIRRLNELSERFTKTQLEKIELTSELKVVSDILNKKDYVVSSRADRLFVVPIIRNDPAAVQASRGLTEAEEKRARLSEVYGPEHPLMRSAQTEVDRLAEALGNSLNQILISLVNKSKALENREKDLELEYEEQKKQAIELARDAFEFTQLRNEVDRHRRLLDELTKRIRDIDISAGFVRTNVQTVENAKPPASPVRPQRKRTIIMAAFFGLSLGIGLAFFLDHLDETIKTPEDLRSRLEIPLLGFIPEIRGRDKESAETDPGLVTLLEPVSSSAEAYRNIRTSLFFSGQAENVRVLGFTSCGPAEGKTTTVTNTAVVIARSGKRVLLVDADLHRSMVNEVFNLDNSRGLTTILQNKAPLEDVLQHVVTREGAVVENLDVLTAGPEVSDPAELLGSPRMGELLQAFRASYDWVLIDTPPILFISDARIVSAVCDGVVLVVRSGMNNRSMVVRTKEHLEEINVRMIGSILNRLIVGRAGRYYSDYYHYGYSRHRQSYHKSYYTDRPDDDRRKGKNAELNRKSAKRLRQNKEHGEESTG